MRLVTWRDVGADTFHDIWHRVSRRWAERLAWDSSSNWALCEHQRQSGALPGLVLADGDRVAAWCYFGIHRDTLQIGGFESDSVSSTRMLLDAVLSVAPRELAPAGVMCFAFTDAPGLESTLRARGFEIERYCYLTRDLTDTATTAPDPDWDRRFGPLMSSLLERAYGSPTMTRPFARQGRPEEWREYVGQLLGSDACGHFEPRLSASRVSDDGELVGAVVTTVVGPGSAHVAQVAVVPELRGRGLASGMLRDVFARARVHGLASVSLLVAEHNTGARHIYESLGFRGHEHFLSAGRSAMADRRDAVRG